MKIPRHKVAAVLAKRSLGTINAAQFGHEIAAYLLSDGRVHELDSLMRDIMQYRADQGTLEVIATSAHPLNDIVRADIRTQIRELYPAAKNIIISEQSDENIIGGVKLELANQQLDVSVRAKLNQFKQLTTSERT